MLAGKYGYGGYRHGPITGTVKRGHRTVDVEAAVRRRAVVGLFAWRLTDPHTDARRIKNQFSPI